MPICFPLPNGELGLVIVDQVPKTMFLQSRLDWYYPPQLSVDANSDRSLVIQSFATIDRLRLTPRAPRRRVPVTVSQVKRDSDGSQIGSRFTHNGSQNATFLGRCNSSLTLKQLQGCRPIRLRKPNGVKLDALVAIIVRRLSLIHTDHGRAMPTDESMGRESLAGAALDQP
jgi:hypothetical protein